MRALRYAVVGFGAGLAISACANGTTKANANGDMAGPSASDGGLEADAYDAMPNDTGLSDESMAASEGDGAASDSPADAPTEAAPPAPHTLFVSSQLYDGNLGGPSGADSKCQALAVAAGLAGTYKAWLSDSTASASYRLTHSKGPYVLVDGTVVAQCWNQLVSGGDLLHAIDKTESDAGSDAAVWTDTDPSGNLPSVSGDCSAWTDNTIPVDGVTGLAGSTSDWTQQAYYSDCFATAALYCVQQ
jgi:hypothetical protein